MSNFPGAGGTGGQGAGFQLFTQSDNNSGIYADAAARDVYFDANQSEVNRVANDESLIIKLLDNGLGEVAYQQYDGAEGIPNDSADWLDVTSLVQGEAGEDSVDVSELVEGDTVRFNSTTQKLEPAPATVDDVTGEFTFDKSINVPAGSINVGRVLQLSEGIADLVVVDKLNESMAFSVNADFNDTMGSSIPFYYNFGIGFNANINLDDSQILTANPLDFSITGTATPPDVTLVDKATIKTNGAMTNVVMRVTDNASGKVIRYIPSEAAWDGRQDGFTLGAGLTITIYFAEEGVDDATNIYLDYQPFLVTPGQQLDFSTKGDSIDLLGEIGGTPYLVLEVHDGPPIELGQDDHATRVQATGIIEGGLITLDTATTVDWTSGSGQIADYTDAENPVVTDVSWAAVAGLTPTDIATDGTTAFGYNSAGVLVEKLLTAVTILDSHTTIWFGSVTHLSSTIVNVITAPANLGYDGLGSFSDFINLVIGPANITGNTYSSNGANLSIDVLGGQAYMIGSNFRNSTQLPDTVTLANDILTSFNKLYRSADPGLNMLYDGLPTTLIDPTQYDDGSGVLQAVTAGFWTIQRIFRSRDGKTFVAYGQEEFATDTLALESLGKESFEEKSALNFTLFRSSLLVQESATDLSDIAQAEFFEQSSFRVSGAQSSSTSVPGITSPGGSDTNVQFNDGGSFGGTDNFTFTSVGFSSDINLQIPNAAGSAGYLMHDELSVQKVALSYSGVSDEATLLIDSSTSGGFKIRNNGASNITSELVNIASVFEIVSTAHTDAHALVTLASTSGSVDLMIGTDDPTGSISATGGTFYFRDGEADSSLYVKRSAGAASTAGWTDVLDSLDGDVVGPASAIDSTFPLYDGITGKLLKAQTDLSYISTATFSETYLRTPSATGSASYVLSNDVGSPRGSFSYEQTANELSIFIPVNGGFRFDNSSSGNVTIDQGASSSVFEVISTAHTDVHTLVTLASTTGSADLMIGTSDPTGSISATGGTFYFRDAEASSSLYVKQSAGAASTTGWANLLDSLGGDVVGPASSVDRSIAVFDGITGKLIDGVDTARILTSGGNNTTLELDAQSISGATNILMYDNAATLQALIGYANGSNTLSIISTDGGDIAITSGGVFALEVAAGPIDLKILEASTLPILAIENNTNSLKFYAHTGNPNGVITAEQGDIVVDETTGATQIFQQQGTGSGNSYAQVENFQKQYTTVTTTSTLSRDFNRALIANTTDIDITIPTNAATAQADGFEQTIIKTTDNDNVISIQSPGFLSGLGNYILSRKGDSITYLQTDTDNFIVTERRDAYATISKNGGADFSINGANNSDIELQGYTADDHSYFGLCEADFNNDRINFVDVEDLINGDLYEVELSLSAKWSNQYHITFFASVYDKGIFTNYPIHIRETSDSTNDYQQLTGRGYVRTGINDTAPGLDTYVQAIFRLSNGAVLNVQTMDLTIRKMRG